MEVYTAFFGILFRLIQSTIAAIFGVTVVAYVFGRGLIKYLGSTEKDNEFLDPNNEITGEIKEIQNNILTLRTQIDAIDKIDRSDLISDIKNNLSSIATEEYLNELEDRFLDRIRIKHINILMESDFSRTNRRLPNEIRALGREEM